MNKRLVARWQTKGNDYLNLFASTTGYYYEGKDCGGNLPTLPNDDAAIAWMERPWNGGAGPVTVLKTDRPSLQRVQ